MKSKARDLIYLWHIEGVFFGRGGLDTDDEAKLNDGGRRLARRSRYATPAAVPWRRLI